MSVKISGIEEMSYAEKAKIKPGESLLAINGNEIDDVLDYRFYQVNKKLILKIQQQNGRVRSVKIKKPEYAEIGLLFDSYLMDEQHSCKNKCIFCFIDQLPDGMRESLYFKDDDSRLSFLFGNYITLTNLSEHEVERIIKMHISPINISVHTTNPDLRCRMMNNRFAGEKLEILKRLASSGLVINCQIVACPGINDGEELRRTLSDLYDMDVNSVAVVPVGLTKYRDGLFPLVPYTKETAEETIRIIDSFGDRSFKEKGRRTFFASDEFYIKAEIPLPQNDFYEDYPCIENGVGMITLLKEELSYAIANYDGDRFSERKVSIACGTAAEPFMRENAELVMQNFPGVCISVYGIENKFFGNMITVSGLVVGRDLIDALKGRDLGERLIIPSAMLRNENDIFLDDISVSDAERELSVKLYPSDNDGEELLAKIMER